MRKVKRFFSGIIALLLLIASIPMNVFGATSLTITSQPTNQSVIEGKTVKFTVGATGATSYQWQVDTGSGWKNLSNETTWKGYNTSVLSFVSKASYLNYKFRCVVKDNGGGKVISDVVKFEFFKITSQPTNQSVISGKPVTFTVGASGAQTYQWQVDTGSGWKNLTNATTWKGYNTNSLNFTSKASYLNYKFRCVLKDTSGGKLISDVVKFEFRDPLLILEQPDYQWVSRGEQVSFFVDAQGAETYQWQVNTGSSWKNLSENGTWFGVTSPELSFEEDEKFLPYSFRCVVKDVDGNKIISDAVSFHYLMFTITFDAGNGRFKNNFRYWNDPQEPGLRELGPWNQLTGELERPVWDEHVFVGWKYNGRLTNQVNVEDEVYVVAEWADACSIRYNLNGGHLSDEAASMAADMGYITEGNILKETVAPGTYFIPGWIEPQKEGYFFKGWKYQSAYMRSATVNSTRRTIELMADWEEAALVTYDANGGYWLFDEEEGEFDTVSFYQPKGTYYLGWHSPEREGYYFYGWMDANGRNKVKVNLTQDATFRALWHAAYNVTYHGNGGQFDEEEFHDDWNYRVGDVCNYYGKNYECISEVNVNGPTPWEASKWKEITINDVVREERGGNYHVGSVQNPYREGYQFMGWSGISNAPRGEWGWDIPLQADMEFYAIWAKEDITITFDSNGGYIPWGEDDEYQEYTTMDFDYNPWEGMDMIMANKGERDEYIFLGWSEDPDATEAEYFEHQRVYFDDSVTLYAVWEKRAAIVFEGNGGTWTWEEWDDAVGEIIERTEETRTEYRDNGTFYYVRTWEPEREGYRFDGWLDKEGNPVDDSQYIVLDSNEEYVFTANWIKKIVITYDANGGDWGEDEESNLITQKYWDGDEGDVHIGMEWPHRDYNTFVGWSLDPDADSVTDDIEHDFDVILHEDATYYAIWSEPFMVTYDANGGVFWYDDDNPVTEEIDNNVNYGEYDLRDRYHMEGYELLGWDEDPDVTEPAYQPRERIIIKGETTFYAIWHKYPTVTYNAGEGQWGDEQHPEKTKIHWSVEGEYYYIGMEQPWREGYEFSGWVDAEGNNVDGMLITMDQDREFFASWKKWINVRYYANGGQFFDWSVPNPEETATKVINRDAKTGEEYYLDGWQPERPGYQFLGWAYEEDATEEDIIENPVIFETEDFEDENEIELCAVWGKLVDVTYDFNGGEWDHRGSETWNDILASSEFDVGFEWPYKAGYEFLGWSDKPDATDAEPNYSCVLTEMDSYEDYGDGNATVTFYAIWDRKAVVTFDAGDGVFENGANVITQYFRIGDIVDWDRDFGTEGDENIRPELDGYMFAGWTYYDADLDTYQEFRYQPVTEDITLYAKWIELNTVTLDANGGIVCDEEGNPAGVINITENVDCTLPASQFEPVREGYEFVGWYNANDEMVNCITFAEDYTLTARWIGEGESNPNIPDNLGVSSLTISTDKETVAIGETFQLTHEADGIGYTYYWWRSTDQENWRVVNEGDYSIEESLDSPGTYYYQLAIDDMDSNIISVTVVEE